jgi:hypothetical protein
MKLPRWLVVSLLIASVLAVVGAAVWWVTWPERTMREFTTRIAESDWDGVERMMGLAPQDSFSLIWMVSLDGWDNWAPANLKAKQRSLQDVINGRKEYRTSRGYTVVAEHGKVRTEVADDSSYSLGIIRMSGNPELVEKFKGLIDELQERMNLREGHLTGPTQ